MTERKPGAPERDTPDQRLDALGRVAGELIHDMANLVAVLDGRLRLALSDARHGRVPAADLERAVDGCGDLGAMIHDVLATLREETVSPEVQTPAEAVVERAIRRALETYRPVEIRMESHLPADTAVRGRGSFLYRAVSNLLANAGRHAVGQVHVTLQFAEEDGRVSIRVEDDGPGVPAQARGAVFAPLVRGKDGGTGLGLSSVAWSVSQLGGEVRCTRSRRLGGACFEIVVPAAGPLAPRRPTDARALAGRRVLVVDDNADVRRALGRFLRRIGAEVVELGPGCESEEQLLHTVIRSIPDAILLDLDLGVRTGVELWSLLREQVPPLARRVVFLSGLAPGDALFEEARRTGQRVLPKPFDFDELAAALDALAREV